MLVLSSKTYLLVLAQHEFLLPLICFAAPILPDSSLQKLFVDPIDLIALKLDIMSKGAELLDL